MGMHPRHFSLRLLPARPVPGVRGAELRGERHLRPRQVAHRGLQVHHASLPGTERNAMHDHTSPRGMEGLMLPEGPKEKHQHSTVENVGPKVATLLR